MTVATFLNGRGYTQLRGALWLLLSDSGQVLSGTITDDTGGGGTTVWGAGSAIPCRIDPIGGGEALAGARISDRSTHVIMVPPGVVVNETNRFAISNRGTFEITAVREHTAEPVRQLEAVHL